MADRPTTGFAYRPHLDGIRTVAVVAVILFHLGYGWIPGGFVGVDVFFVLSGYLITGILAAELDDRDTLRLSRFYSRRVRRLLPASLTVLAVTLAIGWYVFDAVERRSLGWDGSFASLWSANWRFALVGGDYFAPGDIPSPIVHYWSLAVEEQFYLVWPALLLLLHRIGRRTARPHIVRIGIVTVLLTASAVWSIVDAGSSLTYYGSHTRAYQLLAGALLALLVHRFRWRLPDRAPGTVLAWGMAGGGLLALGVLAHRIPDASRYPGWDGVFVTIASLAVIIGADLADRSGPARLLGHALPAAIGRLSYSLYIWHWPIIVLLPLLGARWDRPVLTERWLLTVAMATIAAVSYVAVERPIRFRLRPQAAPLRVVAIGIGCSVLVATAAYARFQPRDPDTRWALDAVTDLARPEPCPYFVEDWPDPADSEPCLLRDGAGPTIALVGDSHAQQWHPAIEVYAATVDARIIRATRGGCPANDVTPFIRDESGQVRVEDDCTAWRRHVYPQMIDRFDPDVIVVATRSHVRGLRVDGEDLYPDRPPHLEAWADGWDRTLDLLTTGRATVLVRRILPTLPERVPACLAEHGRTTTACDFPVAGDTDVAPYDELIDRLDDRDDDRIRVFDPTPLACPEDTCPAVIHGTIVHRDDNHLSATFVREHTDEFIGLLREAGAPLP